jgi:large subunit ribosomal protein L15
MDLSKLDRGFTRSARRRVGRGPASGNGKTSGRGHKGQKARSGYSRRNGFEGGQMPLIRRMPKRGFFHYSRRPVAVINVDALETYFESGADVDLVALQEAGLIKRSAEGVKLLGRGELSKRLNVKVQAIAESAKAKIEAAGGSVQIIQAPAHEAAGEE